MDMTTDVLNKVVVALSIAVVTGIGLWIRKHWLMLLANRFVTNYLEPMSKIAQLVYDVGEIKKEVQTNSGSSLKDQVAIISDNVSLLEARQRGLLAALPRAVFETDDKFNWIDANLAMERLTGKGFDNLALRRWVAAIHEEDRVDVMTELHNAVQDKRGVNMSFRFRTEDGIIPVAMEATPIFSRINPNTVICWSGSMKMVDDQRTAERRRL